MALKDRRLSWQQPLQAKTLERYVYTEAELLEALGALTAAYVASTATILIYAPTTKIPTIYVAGDVVLSKTLKVSCPVTFRAHGSGGFTAALTGNVPMVQLQADAKTPTKGVPDVSFERIRFVDTNDALFADLVSAAGSLVYRRLAFDRCYFIGGGALITGSAVIYGGHMSLCAIGTGTPAVQGDIRAFKFIGNDFGGNLVLNGGASNGSCVISGNAMNGNIDTSAGGGGNAITGNLMQGNVVVPAATDVQAGNVP